MYTDEMFREVRERHRAHERAQQQKAAEFINIRSRARAQGDTSMADHAYDNIKGVHGAGASFWSQVREDAQRKGDTRLADLALGKMNEGPSVVPPSSFPFGFGS